MRWLRAQHTVQMLFVPTVTSLKNCYIYVGVGVDAYVTQYSDTVCIEYLCKL